MIELICAGACAGMGALLLRAVRENHTLAARLRQEQDRAAKARYEAAGSRQEADFYKDKLGEMQTVCAGKAQQVAAMQAALRDKEDLLDEARAAACAAEERLREQTKARLAAEQALTAMRGDMEQERRQLEHEKAVVTDMLRILDYTGGPTA